MRRLALVFVLVLVFLFVTNPFYSKSTAFAYSTNMDASVVIGQINFTNNSANNNHISDKGYDYEYGMATDGTHLFASDCSNNRVLIYNSIPTSNNASADVVIGQPDMQSNQANQGGSPDANTLNCPTYLSTDGTHLFVADANNQRVLIYNHIPTSNNASADVVIGQPDMQSNQQNQGGNPDVNTTDGPIGVSYDSPSGKLFIFDYNNNRILIYNHIPTSNNASADVVIGQPDMQSNQINQGGNPDANTIDGSYNARVIQNKLLIADGQNNRILIYNSIPTSNNASADVVIGQPDMQSNQANQGGSAGANTLNDPEGELDIFNGKLFVGDSNNNRVLIYDSVPTSNNASADVVVGQPNFTSSNKNGIKISNSNGLDQPYGVASDGTRLVVADCGNNRMLIYNHIPTSNNASADVVVGQPDMNSHQQNQGGSPDANTLQCPEGVTTDGTKLLVTDSANNRLLIYNHIPTSNNASADVVIGQPDMQSNQGGSTDANTLACPDGIFYDYSTGKLFVDDDCSSRVLIYNSIPTTNNASADVVIGQPDMTSNNSNQGGIPDANTLSSPVGVTVVGGKLIVADDSNNRVLIYNSIPTTNNASADVVVGQPDFTHNDSNQGGSPDANTFNEPNGLASDGTNLFVKDQINSRALLFNSIPTSNNVSADVVFGQPDFTSNSVNQGVNAASSTLNFPYIGIIVINNQLILSDTRNNRVLIYNDDSVTPTPTPTPSSSGSSSSSSTSGSSPSSSSSCSPAKPSSIPDLFEIDAKDTSATLFITPVLGADRYTVSYGYNKDDNRFAAEFIHKDTSGVIPIRIDYLNPSTTYFFKVKAANGCAYGDFSNELSTTTTKKGSLTTNKSYKNFFSAILSFIPKQTTVNLKPATVNLNPTTHNQPKPQTQTKNNSLKTQVPNPKPISCAINFLGIKLFCK